MSSSDLNVVTSVFSLSKSADRELSLASVAAMVVAMEDAMVAVACLNRFTRPDEIVGPAHDTVIK